MSKKKSNAKKQNLIIVVAVIVILVLVALFAILYTTGNLDAILDKLPGATEETPDANKSDTPSNPSATSRGASVGTIDGVEQIKIHFVDIGQGDAIIIDLPNGEYMLIDAGSGAKAAPSTEIQNYYYGYLDDVVEGNVINYLIASHADSDHVNMLTKVLNNYEVKNVYYNQLVATNKISVSKTYEKFMTAVNAEENAEVTAINTSDNNTYSFSVGDCSFLIFSPGNDGFGNTEALIKNGMSIMVLMTYHERKILFTGDATADEEAWFIEYTSDYESMDVDFLKVGHHGSKGSNNSEFFSYIKPEYGVISVGEGNSYGHPNQEALDRLGDADVTVYRTDLKGTIVLTLDDDGDYLFEFKEKE